MISYTLIIYFVKRRTCDKIASGSSNNALKLWEIRNYIFINFEILSHK